MSKKEKETAVEATEEPVVSEPVEVVSNELPEETVDNTEEIAQFKSHLVQAIEVNDSLIKELEKRETDISVFKELHSTMEQVLLEKDTIISQLHNQILELQFAKFNERKQEVANKWITKFCLPQDKIADVQRMLSKFSSEDELVEIEHMLNLSGSIKLPMAPEAFTETSAFLDSQVGDVSEPVKTKPTVDELFLKIEGLKKQNNI